MTTATGSRVARGTLVVVAGMLLSVLAVSAPATATVRVPAHSASSAAASHVTASRHSRVRNLARNGNFQRGHRDWSATGTGAPHSRIVHPGYRSGSAIMLWNARHRRTVLNDRPDTVSANRATDRYRASAEVRTFHPKVQLHLRVSEYLKGTLVGHTVATRTLRGSGWHRISVTYTARRTGSVLDLNVIANRLRGNRSFEVDRIKMVRTYSAPAVSVVPPLPLGPQPVVTPPAPVAPTSSPTGTPSATPTVSPTDSSTSGPPSPPSSGSTSAPAPTVTPTASPTASSTPTGTPTSTPTPTGTPTSTPTPTATSSGPVVNNCQQSAILVPSCGVLWGSYAHPVNGQDPANSETQLEAELGRNFDLTYHYHDFSGPANATNGGIPNSYEKSLAASGHIIFDDWGTQIFSTGTQLQWADIAAGDYDNSVIIPEAQSIKAFGQPMMLSIDHEMDALVGTDGTAADYVAAYRHIHDVFAAQGVTNVIWVWTTTGYSGRFSMFNSLYPGNAYVDWIGYDPYNFGTCHSSTGTYKSFQQTIDPMYQWLETNGYGDKPFILPEYGTVPNPSDANAAATWYASVPAGLAAHPNIKALLQWDDAVGACDTYLNDAPGVMSAFAQAGMAPAVLGRS